MEIDATQVLDLGYDDEEEESIEKKEVGRLKVLRYKEMNEIDFPIYEGTNIIGRDARSNIPIKVQALSKKHACIEVSSDSCLVYDFDSRNKTRKGKMVLKPLVRYELKDGDELTFADVSTQFCIIEAEANDVTGSITDGGSETESESMIPEETKEDIILQDDEHFPVDELNAIEKASFKQQPETNINDNVMNESNMSDSILLPTQRNGNNHIESKGVIRKEQGTDDELYAAETESESEGENASDTPSKKKSALVVAQTPGFSLSQIQTKIRERIIEDSFDEENQTTEPCLISNDNVMKVDNLMDEPLETSDDQIIDDQNAATVPIERNNKNESIPVDTDIDEKKEEEIHQESFDQLGDTVVIQKGEDQVGQDDAYDDEMVGTYVFDDFNYEGEDESSSEDETNAGAKKEENNEKEDKCSSLNSLLLEDDTIGKSQEIPFSSENAPEKCVTSTQLLDSFQSFGTPTSSISQRSFSSVEIQNKSYANSIEKQVVSDSEEEQTQPYQRTSPFKNLTLGNENNDLFKIPLLPNGSLPGGSGKKLEYYEAVDASTHMSSSDDDTQKKITARGVSCISNGPSYENLSNDEATQVYNNAVHPNENIQEKDIAGGSEFIQSLTTDVVPTQAYNLPEYNDDIATQAYADSIEDQIDTDNAETQAYTNDATQSYLDQRTVNKPVNQEYNIDIASTQVYIETAATQAYVDIEPTQVYQDEEGEVSATQAYCLSETNSPDKKLCSSNNEVEDDNGTERSSELQSKTLKKTRNRSSKRITNKSNVKDTAQLDKVEDPEVSVKANRVKKAVRFSDTDLTTKVDENKANTIKKPTRRSKKTNPATCITEKDKDTEIVENIENVNLKSKTLKKTRNRSSKRITNKTNVKDTTQLDKVADPEVFVKANNKSIETRLKRNTIRKKQESANKTSKEVLLEQSSEHDLPDNITDEPTLTDDSGTSIKQAPQKRKRALKQIDSPRGNSNVTKPRIVFTGISDKAVEKIVTDLGGEVVDSVSKATHLVTDKIRRTVKFLCAVAKGIPIVDPAWLKAAKSSNLFTTFKNHLLLDYTTEKQYKFQLQKSIEKATTTALLQNYKVHVTKNVKPDPKNMKELIESSKGKFLAKCPAKPSDEVLIISCEEDQTEYQKYIAKGFTVCSNEVILTGILRQEIDTVEFLLKDIDEVNVGMETTTKRKRQSSTVQSTSKRKR